MLLANVSNKYSEHVSVHGMVVMHVFKLSFRLKRNFDNSLYNNPLTVNHLFIFIMFRIVDENKVQLDLVLKNLFQAEFFKGNCSNTKPKS